MSPENPFAIIDQRLRSIETLLTTLVENQELILGKVQREKPFIKIDEAAQLVGLTKSTVYQMVSHKTIPHIKQAYSGRLLFKRVDLIEWLDSSKQKAIAP